MSRSRRSVGDRRGWRGGRGGTSRTRSGKGTVGVEDAGTEVWIEGREGKGSYSRSRGGEGT